MTCADCDRPLRIIRYRFRKHGELLAQFVLVDSLCAVARMKKGQRCA